MKQILIVVSILLNLVSPIAAQQNWAAIPCSRMKQIDNINKMFVDSLHNEIICGSLSGFSICNTTYKGLYAYNGSGFHDLDKGIDTHDGLNQATNGSLVRDCIRFGDKTLYGGGFLSVSANTLYAKSIALWNGSSWSNFPTPVFDNTPNWNTGGGFHGFVRWNGKLYMYGGFNMIGSTVTKNLAAYENNTFTAVPSIPVNNYVMINKAVVYKNKLVVSGNFYDTPSFAYFRLAQFDGTTWSQVGNGITGSLSNCQDMVVYNDTLYIAGSFPKGTGNTGNAGNYLMKWDGSQLRDAGFGGWCGYAPITALVPYRNRLYAFGGFSCAAFQKAFGVAYYENGVWTVPQDSIEGPSILGAVVYNDQIYIGGGFRSIGGDTTIQKFARLMCPDFDAASGCISSVKETKAPDGIQLFPNPASDKLSVKCASGLVDGVNVVNALGQQIHYYTGPFSYCELDISFLANGMYLFTVQSQSKIQRFKVVKE